MLPPPTSHSAVAVVVVAAGIGTSAVVALAVGARPAAFLLAGIIGGLALARGVLPPDRIQPFVVRDVWVDVAVMGGVSFLLVLLTSLAPH